MSGLYRLVERFLARHTDVFVAVGEGEASTGREVLPVGEMTVVPNGVDTDYWSPGGPVGPTSHGPLIVCVGRLSRQKGQDLAIEALARLVNRNVTLRLLGDGPAEEELTQLASALGVLERVEFWGSVAHPDRHLRAADVVVVPSRWDGMSLALLEAMAVGTAIVATDVAGAEVLGDAGVIVPTDDVDSLKAAVEELLNDEPRRRRLGVAARQAASKRSLDANLERMVSLWEETMAAASHRRRGEVTVPPGQSRQRRARGEPA
jgi:glycosyltransferase involved in cell wall biosynthesis